MIEYFFDRINIRKNSNYSFNIRNLRLEMYINAEEIFLNHNKSSPRFLNIF